LKKIRVSVVGATGYAGKELIKLLIRHARVELIHLTSSSYHGKTITEVYPEFLNKVDRKLIDFDPRLLSRDSDLIFTALSHTVSLEVIPELFQEREELRIIDLSADYRLKDFLVYQEWYKKEHSPESKELLRKVVYGLPELYASKIKHSSFIANPGCYPTSVILGIAPLLKYHLVKKEGIIIDSKSGTTGAGRNLSFDLHFSECNENFKAYKIIGHNHIPEIEQELSLIYFGKKNWEKGKAITVSFTPHLLPLNRGILSTCYLSLKEVKEEGEILKIYNQFYHQAPFIRIFEPPALPELKFISETNYCDIGFRVDKRIKQIKVISAIDNLVKGAAGQAVQNMNIMCNFPETCGLEF